MLLRELVVAVGSTFAVYQRVAWFCLQIVVAIGPTSLLPFATQTTNWPLRIPIDVQSDI